MEFASFLSCCMTVRDGDGDGLEVCLFSSHLVAHSLSPVRVH